MAEKWEKAVFTGTSSYLGPQQGETYTVQVRTPGQLYPYCVLTKELPGASEEYLTLAALRADWQFQPAPAAGSAR